MEDDFMAHLLMIDSWVGGNGVILPRLLDNIQRWTVLDAAARIIPLIF
jgi:hypothetical protein